MNAVFSYATANHYDVVAYHNLFFITFTVIDWVDIFTRKDYKYIITDSLNYCIKEKGLECFAWVLMSNHMHLVARAVPPFRLSDIIRDFKKVTSKKIAETIQTINESRKEWLLHKFEYAAKSTGRAKYYKVWQDSNHAICVEGDSPRFRQRIDYTHQNPVRQMIVDSPEKYLFSSAVDYWGNQGLVKVTIAY